MCGSTVDCANTMPRSFLVKKNSNYTCPPKKRPLAYFLQDVEVADVAEILTGRNPNLDYRQRL